MAIGGASSQFNGLPGRNGVSKAPGGMNPSVQNVYQGRYHYIDDAIFDDIKRGAICVWQSFFDDTYGYATEKVDRIIPLRNESTGSLAGHGDIIPNWMVIVNMFDSKNKQFLLETVDLVESKKLLTILLQNERLYQTNSASF